MIFRAVATFRVSPGEIQERIKLPSIVGRRSIRFAKRTLPAGRAGPGDGEGHDDLRILVATVLAVTALAKRLEAQPTPFVADDPSSGGPG